MRFRIGQEIVCVSHAWEQTNNLSLLQRIGLKSKKALGPKYNEIVTVESYNVFAPIHCVLLIEYPHLTAGKRNAYIETLFEPVMSSEALEHELESIKETSQQ